MEYLWYIVASLGAGIGTGLVGISAATVMVPIMIVLCPSFAGKMGVYQSTAIALMSDVLGSAGTSYIYMKNKNIDIKRAMIMLYKTDSLTKYSFDLEYLYCEADRVSNMYPLR